MTYNSKNFLLLGDAYPSTVVDGLKYFGFSEENPLKAEFVKVSHHGSKANTNYELLSLIDSDKFIISTNGTHNLPNKQCLARIINSKPGVSLYFNYPDLINEIFSSEDREEFQFSTLSCDDKFMI
jgi:beta-lactamase superfamily II metal-dependent hydrolase